MASFRRMFVVLGGALLGLSLQPSHSAEPPLKVFILAGQSNMQGHARLRTIDHLGKHPQQGALLRKIKNPDGSFVVRDDVWIAYPERKKYGKLTVGYGASNDEIGPELMFGCIVGDHFQQPVLLIKTAWGGRSVALDFRSPGAGEPQFELNKKLKERIAKGTFQVGSTYRLMIRQVRDVLGNLSKHFPQYKGQGYELAGFVWFQGWNDMINPTYTAEYTSNLAHMIRDVRKDLQAPKLPVVIGELGVGGNQANAKMLNFRKAQAAVAALPEFRGNVAFVPTARYWDKDAHAFLQKNWVRRKWSSQDARKTWETMGSNYPFHYMGSARVYSLIGNGLAQAVIELTNKK